MKPAQVDHGHVVSGAQVDGLLVVGHGLLRSPWRETRQLNWCIKKSLSQIQHTLMLWVLSSTALCMGTILREKYSLSLLRFSIRKIAVQTNRLQYSEMTLISRFSWGGL